MTRATRNLNYQDTHRRLIEAGAALLAERTGHAVTIAAVARATGINRTTMYYHFRNRRELLRAVEASLPVRDVVGDLARAMALEHGQGAALAYRVGADHGYWDRLAVVAIDAMEGIRI